MGDLQQHFCLRWNHHQATLINVFDSLLKDERLVDVTLYAEGRPMRAHKVVLSACSNYFQAVFANHAESHPVIILKDVQYSELRALIDYMYRGEVNVSQHQLASLIRTAESLQVKGLADGRQGASGGLTDDVRPPVPESADVPPASPSTSPPPQPHHVASVASATAAVNLSTDVRAECLGARSASPHMPGSGGGHVNGAAVSPALNTAVAVGPLHKRARYSSAEARSSCGGGGLTDGDQPSPTLSSMLMTCGGAVRKTESVEVVVGGGRGSPNHLTVSHQHQHQQQELQRCQSPTTGAVSDASVNVNNVASAVVGAVSGAAATAAAALPNIPATITPLPLGETQYNGAAATASEGGLELDLSVRPATTTGSMECGDGPATMWLDIKQERGSSEMTGNAVDGSGGGDAHSDSGGELDGGGSSEGELAGPSSFLHVRPGSAASGTAGSGGVGSVDAALLQQANLMKWPLTNHSGGGIVTVGSATTTAAGVGGAGVDSPLSQSADSATGPDALLQRALSVRFQHLLNQQRYEQMLGVRSAASLGGTSPVPVAAAFPAAGVAASAPAGSLQLPPATTTASICGGLPLLMKRESPTSPGKQYPCDRCGRHYASTGNLKRHIKYECGVEPQFQCPVCKKKFQHRHSVKIHVVSTHKTENPELIKDYIV